MCVCACVCVYLCVSNVQLTCTPLRQEEEGEGEGAKLIRDPGLRLGDYPVLPWLSAQLNKQTGWWQPRSRDKETPVR